MFSRNQDSGGSDESRQILITLVDANGPAAGKLALGDVVIGIDGEKFTRNARKSLAEAIDKAESTAGAGRLSLLVWRHWT